MIATKFSVLQHVCVVAFTRASRHRSFTVSASVLLGMSEHDLQQLAVEFGQRSYRAKQLHHLIYKEGKRIQDFSHLPQAFRNDLIEADWKIGRSPIYHTVTAADGTVKLLISWRITD
ncbi:probable dual-specificity RNA methyltransferase RlmN [Hibiscus syriacus]|uniref:probable dual-specificity RNA methyltransferase RlmN n=1 Tax=Hibiscus syriacus TaxID=106335 RepID=UPI001924B3DB|nr:probable dual-specificity RNA methyltransferase RlmN [Hibiscus syriacus]